MKFNSKGLLPPGIHVVTLEQLETNFTWSNHRKKLFKKFKGAYKNLTRANVKKIWIDGSYVESKEHPNDIDGCWEYTNDVNVDKLDPVFLDFHPPREAMKKKYGVDFLISNMPMIDLSGKQTTIVDFFQISRSGDKKGILLIQIP